MLATLPYLQTLGFDYTLDDRMVVRDNPAVVAGRCLDAMTGPYWPAGSVAPVSNWRPLASGSWCLERQWVASADGQARLPLHHAANVVLYAAVVLALFAVARRIVGSVRAGWVVCALFALHPAHADVVAPLVGRTDLLATLGGLVMVAAFWRHRDGGGVAWLALATAGYAVGLGGKESAAPLLLLLPLADRLLFGKPWRSVLGRDALSYAPLVAVALVYAIARSAALGDTPFGSAAAEEMGVLGRAVFAARNSVLSFALLVAPIRFHHALTTLPPDAPFTFAAPGPLAGLVWLLLAGPVWVGWTIVWRRSGRATISWLGALLPWLPTSGLVPAGAGLALRFLFLPSAFALCGAVIGGRALMARSPSWRTSIVAIAAAWSIAAAVLSWTRVPAWRDNVSFHSAVLAEEPDSFTASYSLGAALGERGGDLAEARRWLEHAVAIAGDTPISINARVNLAVTYEFGRDGTRYGEGAQLDRALAIYREALRIVPDSGYAATNAAAVAHLLSDRAGSADRRRALAAEAVGYYEIAIAALGNHHPFVPTLRREAERARATQRSAE